MKLQFNPNQKYQLDAISSVTDLFEGQEKLGSEILPQKSNNVFLDSFSNKIAINEKKLNENLKKVQLKNNIYPSTLTENKEMNFSVEMETGTGKTYVYLRTIFDLNKQYGFSKFIVVVPSVAIREGVLNP